MKVGMGGEEGPGIGKGGAEGREEGWVQVPGRDESDGERGGRKGGGEGREEASWAHRSACSFPGMLQWAGTQQRVTVLCREWRRVKYSIIDERRGWGRE